MKIERSMAASADAQTLADRLYEYNSRKIGVFDGQSFAFLVRDAAGELIAGISGWTWAGACEIEYFWVQAEQRGKRLGEQLLHAAEDEARERGCAVIYLSSYSFQAPGFYQKQGYEQCWKIEGFPPGQAYYHFVKRLGKQEVL